MDNFESELNIIHQLLKNDETYTKLIVKKEHYSHYAIYKVKYDSIYGISEPEQYFPILINVLHNNTHVNEIYMDINGFSRETDDDITEFTAEFTKKIIKMKDWKSIYIQGESDSVLDALLTQQNPKLMKLELSQIFFNSDKLLKIFQNTNSLEEFELCISNTPEINFCEIIEIIHESNIKTVIINDITCIISHSKFINSLSKCKMRNLHLKNLRYICEFDLTHNCTLMNFTVNGIQPNYAQETLNRNKNYVFIVLLCMNRKIIPRCVFKNLIVKHLFIL